MAIKLFTFMEVDSSSSHHTYTPIEVHEDEVGNRKVVIGKENVTIKKSKTNAENELTASSHVENPDARVEFLYP